MPEKPWIALAAASIGAVATVAAAWIAASSGRVGDREAEPPLRELETKVDFTGSPKAQGPQGATRGQVEGAGSEAGVGDAINRYEFHETVSEGDVFIDPFTGVVVGVEKIKDTWFWGLSAECIITFPEFMPDLISERIPDTPTVGWTYKFTYRGRKFHLIVEAIDNGKKTTTLRVREP